MVDLVAFVFERFGQGVGKAQLVGSRKAYSPCNGIAQFERQTVIQRGVEVVLIAAVSEFNVVRIGLAVKSFLVFPAYAESQIRAETGEKAVVLVVDGYGHLQVQGVRANRILSEFVFFLKFKAFSAQLNACADTEVFGEAELDHTPDEKSGRHFGIEAVENVFVATGVDVGQVKTGFYAEFHLRVQMG